MLSFTDQLTMCKSISNLSDATSIMNFKRDINAGTARFLSKLRRPVDRQSRFTNIVVAQQYYQMPEDAIRLNKVKSLNGTNIWRFLTEVASEEDWINLNQIPQSGSWATHFFAKGQDEFGIYPIPSQAVTDGIEMIFEPQHVLMTNDDYTTGTISVGNNSIAVVGTTTVFQPYMATNNYYLQVTDGTDGNWYRISGYTDATHITLENFYQGLTNTTAPYRIGQMSRIPSEYQEAPVDYAMYRHFLEKNEMTLATQFMTMWEGSLSDCADVYGMVTGNQVINASGTQRLANPLLDSYQNQILT